MLNIIVHPGEILSDELSELGVSAAQLAKELNVPPNRISQILSGKRSVTADTALRLARWFGTSPEMWMNLQSAYDLALTRQAAGDEIAALPTRAA